MDDNNKNYGNNSYSQENSNNQFNPNNFQFDPNFLNTPQGQIYLQMGGGGGGDESSNRTPKNTDNIVELFPEEANDRSVRVKWSVKEDEALVSAYLHAGGDGKKGTNQSKGDLWKTIMKLYEEAHKDAPSSIKQRTMTSLTSRWETINRDVSCWVGVYAQSKRDKASGIFDEDYNGVKFTLMHAWKEMKHLRKCQAENTEIPSESGGSSKRSHPDALADEGENSRPDGIKKAKKKGKQAASSNVNMDAFTNAISEMNVRTSNRELLGIQMLEYQRERDATKAKQKEDDRQWQLFMFLLNKPHLEEDQKVILANLKEKFNYMFK
ncbi:hypothetical protein RND81_11G085700 [Saponaria officinalis]|uniref:Myb-like domain-containing protein n=1 Tax=Saponaria officinalis TaxID=3572 RepID=A0AAW1HJI7_SAPOF